MGPFWTGFEKKAHLAKDLAKGVGSHVKKYRRDYITGTAAASSLSAARAAHNRNEQMQKALNKQAGYFLHPVGYGIGGTLSGGVVGRLIGNGLEAAGVRNAGRVGEGVGSAAGALAGTGLGLHRAHKNEQPEKKKRKTHGASISS